VENAPTNTIRSLALDDAIEVAEPVLVQSNALDDDTLLDCIASKGQEHMLAIATRAKLAEKVTDQLVIKGDINVLGALANNSGAAISEPGFKMLVEKSLAMTGCRKRSPDDPTSPSIIFVNLSRERRKSSAKD
jgi:uncharacterized protein (DUF2336 family)